MFLYCQVDVTHSHRQQIQKEANHRNRRCMHHTGNHHRRPSQGVAFFMSEVAFCSVRKMLEKGLTLSETNQHTGGHDVSHYIHKITFRDHFPLSTNPLNKDTMVRMEDPTGVGLHQMLIKLVPTKYKKFMQKAKEHFQLSASAYVLLPQRLVGKLPGFSERCHDSVGPRSHQEAGLI